MSRQFVLAGPTRNNRGKAEDLTLCVQAGPYTFPETELSELVAWATVLGVAVYELTEYREPSDVDN
ncbi:MAG: hypothetical protein M3Q75_12740 [Gemmatimonadota bacterium]|nr:hypothetical protein [Gemmatimonadota bacterium]